MDIIILIIALLSIISNQAGAIEVTVCNCESPTIEGILDFNDDTNCSSFNNQGRKQETAVQYHLYTSRPAALKFRGYLCSEWTRTKEVEIFFMGSVISKYTVTPVDVSTETCWQMQTDKLCYDNKMKKAEDKWSYEKEPKGDGEWMRTIRYETNNCIFEEIILEKACPECPIVSPLGPIEKAPETGHYTHNHMTIVWKDEIALHHRPCEVRKLESGIGYLYLATNEEPARIKDPTNQLDFFIGRPSTFPCNQFNKNVYQVMEMEQTFISFNPLNGSRGGTTSVKIEKNETEEDTVANEINTSSHLQYVRDLLIDSENALAREIETLDCQMRKSIHERAASTAQYNGWLAAEHLELPTGQKLIANGNSVLILQCAKSKVTFQAEITACGPQPKYKNYTIGIDGWELVKYSVCYWKFNIINFNSASYSYKNGTWTRLVPNIKIQTQKIIHAFNHTVDNSLAYVNSINPAYERAMTSHINIMADITLP